MRNVERLANKQSTHVLYCAITNERYTAQYTGCQAILYSTIHDFDATMEYWRTEEKRARNKACGKVALLICSNYIIQLSIRSTEMGRL